MFSRQHDGFFFFILGVEKKSILGLLLVLNRLLLMRIHKKTFNETTTNTRFYIGFILGLQVGDDYIASVRGTWHFHRRLQTLTSHHQLCLPLSCIMTGPSLIVNFIYTSLSSIFFFFYENKLTIVFFTVKINNSQTLIIIIIISFYFN